MKKIILTCLASATLVSAQAQLFSPESISGALWGGLMGGIIGGDCRHGFSGDGAAIGAGIGFLAGSIAGESRRRDYYYSQPYAYTPEVTATVGYGYTPYVYYAPNSYCAPGYYYRPTRPNYAVSGTVLGAASGALIGAADRNAGKGAAIGAGAGLLLGSVAEIAERNREKKLAKAQAATVTSTKPKVDSAPQAGEQTGAAAQPAASENETVRPAESPQQNQITSKPSKNSTYHWTPRPQIADAPRVPDAPKF